MNIWAKMMTALRGGVNEAGESVVDSQALRILDQEVRDAADELKQSRDSLAGIIAKQKLAEEKCNRLQKDIGEHEGYAVKALDKNDETLALEVAGKISSLEVQLKSEQEIAAGFKVHAEKMRQAIQHTEHNIKRLKQQVDTVKANENVQRAQAAVAERHSGSSSRLRTAMDSLERIKEKQAMKDAQMAAASEMAESTDDDPLHTKLQAAGIMSNGPSPEEVLARLRNKKS